MNDLQIIGTPESLNSPLETWFIQNVLFSGAPFSLGFDPLKMTENFFVYLEFGVIDQHVVSQIKAAGKNLVLYQMADELGHADIKRYAEYDLVLRNYYRSDIFDGSDFVDRVIWVPNGFRTGVGPRDANKVKTISQRMGIAAFLGWLSNDNSYKNERSNFAKAAVECRDKLYVLPANKFAGGYNVGLYAAIMEDNIFAPCPAGNSPETIRLYDALELGCIPITLRHDFLFSRNALGAIGPPPFVFLDSWSDLPGFLNVISKTFSEDFNKWNVQQQKCLTWWASYKGYIAKTILEKMCEKFN